MRSVAAPHAGVPSARARLGLVAPPGLCAHRGVSAAAYGSRRLLRRPATGGVTVDLSDLLIAYANAVVSRATPGDKSARGLFDDGDSGHRQRKGVQR
jgi:hypothetical protein